jgi:hypothetical protein
MYGFLLDGSYAFFGWLAGSCPTFFLQVYRSLAGFALVVGLGYVEERRSAYTFAFSSVFRSIGSTSAGSTIRKRHRFVIDAVELDGEYMRFEGWVRCLDLLKIGIYI